MARHIEAVMDGVRLADLGNIVIRSVNEPDPEMEIEYINRPTRGGREVQKRKRKALRVTINAAIHELYDLKKRNEIRQAVAKWCDGSILELSNHPGQRLHVISKAEPGIGDVRDFNSEMAIELEANEIPYWEESAPNTPAGIPLSFNMPARISAGIRSANFATVLNFWVSVFSMISKVLFDGSDHADQVAGKPFDFPSAEDWRKGDGILPHPGGPVQGRREFELQDAIRFAGQHVATALQGLDDAVLGQGRVAIDIDLPLLIAEERVGEGHDGEDGENPPDGFPAMLEGNGDILGNHSRRHQHADDDGEKQRDLDEILDGSADVGHF